MMKQLESIEVISKALQKDSDVRAIFLKGSIARDNYDDYSDVDFYCLVKDDRVEEFLKRRLDYLEQYRPLIYWSHSNFVGPQIVAVFDNGLHFDLYTVTMETLQYTDAIKVLYDPEKLLDGYKAQPLSFTEDNFVTFFHEFTFSMLEFEAAYCRKDLLWASRLGSHLSGDLAGMLRCLFDHNNSKLGFKRLYTKLDEDTCKKLSTAMDFLGPSHLPKGVILLGDILKEVTDKLPEEISGKLNKKFFSFMLDRIRGLSS